MVRTSTWVLLLVLAALVGGSLVLRNRTATELAAPTPTASSSMLFAEVAGTPQDIRIENAAGDAVAFTVGDDGKWRLSAPRVAEADQAAAQAAATQIGALRVIASVKLAPGVVGLDEPAFTLGATFSETGSKYTLAIGSVTPIQSGYYCQLDDGPIVVVDKIGLDALIDLLKAPPFPATPTPKVTVAPPPAATATAGEQNEDTVAPTATTQP